MVANEKATLERVRRVLSEYLVDDFVNRIMSEIENTKRHSMELPRSANCNKDGKPTTSAKKPDHETIATARAEAKGIDPLDREQLRLVLDQGGYIKADPNLRRYTLFESEGYPVCLISEETWNNLVLDGEIMAVTRDRNTPREVTTWVAA
jgi:hypothetical protein